MQSIPFPKIVTSLYKSRTKKQTPIQYNQTNKNGFYNKSRVSFWDNLFDNPEMDKYGNPPISRFAADNRLGLASQIVRHLRGKGG